MRRTMASRGGGGWESRLSKILSLFFILTSKVESQVLTPPYFNLAEGRLITSTATCGYGVSERELYCKLVGAHADQKDNPNVKLILGQVCDYCDPSNPELDHPPQNAIDGTEKWWQSPPLSRGNIYNEVNLTIDLGQEFHVAYVFIKMANSPRPGIWALERSTDHGETWQAWQYFADTPNDCIRYFGRETLDPITSDDSVTCETQFSTVVPLEEGEIVVSLLHDRPSANNFYNSSVLQEWTKATNIRMRLLRTKTLLGHLMSIARQDHTVTRRYFYSIRDISIGGRCVCNGHADTCDITDPNDIYKLLCRCQHNTCGAQCEQCCPGFVQKKWRPATPYKQNECEPCNCFGHSTECLYDEETDQLGLSLDIHGIRDGGGVCQNCHHNTEGINCDRCKPRFYRPYGKLLNASDVCHPCQCDVFFSTGSCSDGNGQCECRPEFQSPLCDKCSVGYYGYPDCKACDCHLNGTRGSVCEVGGGLCPCKPNYTGKNCDRCNEGFYNFPECLPCECNLEGAVDETCDILTGQCSCRTKYGGRTCSDCDHGFYDYPSCSFCKCDQTGCSPDVCNKTTGACICKEGFGGDRCDRCAGDYFGYPNCKPCNCNSLASIGNTCDAEGKCNCFHNYAGLTCTHCSPGYYQYPECQPCNCDSAGAVGVSCDDEGRCQCRPNFDGLRCNVCRQGFYNYPACEECNCNPAGVLATFAGCDTITNGDLCLCKERVSGRICHQCKPLYWNLQASNPLGCEDCDCHLPGTMGGLNVCDGNTGQCMCKPNTASRRCQECRDGTYDLQESNLFGCVVCGCNVGGSMSKVCDKQSGQCACHPRIGGQTCDEPMQLHYFPTLYHLQYELENGHTPTNSPVRFGYNEADFPGYSWRGYAIFSPLQKEVLTRLFIEKPSLYRVVLRYVNQGEEVVKGFVIFTPDAYGDVKQSSAVRFEPTKTATLITVSGGEKLSPTHFVINPGQWTVGVKVDKPLLIDYFVLLPAAYYEATLLQEHVNNPCMLDREEVTCRHYLYPELNSYKTFRGEEGYTIVEEEKLKTQVYPKSEVLDFLGLGDKLALLDNTQLELRIDIVLPKTGRYALVVLYYTPDGGKTSTLEVEASSTTRRDKGRAVLYECMFTTLCRQAVTDMSGRIAVFNFDNSTFVTLHLKIPEGIAVVIDSVVPVPSRKWNSDYITPRPSCLRQDGACVEGKFHSIPGTIKVEMEAGQNDKNKATRLPTNILDADVGLIYLDHKDAMVNVHGRVPNSGLYVFVVHYYQPEHPEFELDVVVQNGQFYEAVLPVPFCPSVSGCRSILKEKNGETRFQILENFLMTFKEPNHKSVWLDYILAIPADSYKPEVLEEIPLDRAGEFITQCGQDHFYIDPQVVGFLRESAFILTTEYNNGGLPCQCNFEGSLSLECDKFGGQCLCKPNMIGRTCSECRTGYFGFPDCHACECPSTAVCDPTTGDCICPPRVSGEQCDACFPNTYGFDPIIGCEECNCNPDGVVNRNLQCDSLLGQCECRVNVVGRTCDNCQPGYWLFPSCQLCDCDLRGTTDDICNMDNAQCYCKENVYGPTCDQCKPGTFYLQEQNPLGCTKCFCFGRTDRCMSSTLYRTQVFEVSTWEEAFLQPGTTNVQEHEKTTVEYVGEQMTVHFNSGNFSENVLYFSAPLDYLGNKITSYGGYLRYTITVNLEIDGEPLFLPDVIFVGNNMTLIYENNEQPAIGEPLDVELPLSEHEFNHLSGGIVSREQFMSVLINVEKLYIRGEYFNGTKDVTIKRMMMDVTTNEYLADTGKALSVEQCLCPPNYQGSSCEECARGYYRSHTGPYGGYCVPCQCHGHADSCDSATGKCLGCKHNTTGDHCNKCVSGFHGDATIGTPYDCLICACPLPTMANNFAVSCEFSPNGLEIRCDCKHGYYGPRCSFCAAGFYGRPEIPNEICKPCNCSGNIDVSNFGSCDSQTGECLECLNNTFGQACELCAPGFYGDAVSSKNCKNNSVIEREVSSLMSQLVNTVTSVANSIITFAVIAAVSRIGGNGGNVIVSAKYPPTLTASSFLLAGMIQMATFHSVESVRDHTNRPYPQRYTRRPWYTTPSTTTRRPRYTPPGCKCDRCGTRECHTATGYCRCKDHVIGDKCDQCAPNHYGLDSCNGCSSCACSEASESRQCDSNTGQCKCRPGVSGRTCEHCLPGYWNFGSYGCHACHCNQEYSIGGSCNPQTGQCECLPGVVGDRCDRCPYRWVIIENIGCRECDPCVHVLLDDMDVISSTFGVTYSSIKSLSQQHFAYLRLNHFNKTVTELEIIVRLFGSDSTGVNLGPFENQVKELESETRQLDLRSGSLIDTAIATSEDADDTRVDALALEKTVLALAETVQGIVDDITSLAHRIVAGEGPDVDRKIAEAEKLLFEINSRDFEISLINGNSEGTSANQTLERAREFAARVAKNKALGKGMKERVSDLSHRLHELMNTSRQVLETARKTKTLYDVNKLDYLKSRVASAEDMLNEIKKLLEKGHTLISEARELLDMARNNFEKILDDDAEKLRNLVNRLRREVEKLIRDLAPLPPLVRDAEEHARRLMAQAQGLAGLLADTKHTSENAIRAANSYADIVDAINEALKAAEDAVEAANKAQNKSEGLDQDAEDSKELSLDLLEEAKRALKKVNPGLRDRMDHAKEGVDLVELMNKRTRDGLAEIRRSIDRLPIYALGPAANNAMNLSTAANQKAQKALDIVDRINTQLPSDVERSKQIPRDIEDANKAIKRAHAQIQAARESVPEIIRLMNKLGNRTNVLRVLGVDVADKIAALRRRVELARDKANRIKLGVNVTKNLALELQNPEGLSDAATYTKMSLYFRTEQQDGFLVYLGNEIGTHRLIRRALTDDFMSIGIENGHIVLTANMGSASSRIHNLKDVSDNQWHQVIVERIGLSVKITVRTEGVDDIEEEVVEGSLQGPRAVFNLDQELSKFYVGGIPPHANIQKDILSNQRSFVGEIEELTFNDNPVGLWNFKMATRRFEGCFERDKLVTQKVSSGLRFDGNGYAIMTPKSSDKFHERVEVVFRFKTYAKDGLLFLIGKNADFLAVELRDGRILYHFNLGSGTAILRSPAGTTYNDGAWHSVQASRQRQEAILLMEGEKVDSGSSPGHLQNLEFGDNIYVGGYPGNHSFAEVTNIDFEGCMEELQIGTNMVDLNNNKEALGIATGCPAKVARTISFGADSTGFFALPRVDLTKNTIFTFKFKTVAKSGLLFYLANDDQSHYMSISIDNGAIVFRTRPGDEVRTGSSSSYDDQEWHFVTATRSQRQLRLDIDDYEMATRNATDGSPLIISTPVYVGGTPYDYTIIRGASSSIRKFVGCVGDVTINGVFKNFAGVRRQGGSLASCPLADPAPTPLTEEEISRFTSPAPRPTGRPGTDYPFTEVTVRPTRPVPIGQCALPVRPLGDPELTELSGVRFGVADQSRQEYSIMPSEFHRESNLSAEFKTMANDGIIFYLTDSLQADFIALYFFNKVLRFSYNMGSGTTNIPMPNLNDGKWHSITIFRDKTTARIIIDGKHGPIGTSDGVASTMTAVSPLYVGGVSDLVKSSVKRYLKTDVSFNGCLRNVLIAGKSPRQPLESVGTQPCSDKVEAGSFFSADGGRLILYDNYRVGNDMDIYMEIKPRDISGVIMAIHGGTGDYLALQLLNGTVKFSVDNGAGEIHATYRNPDNKYFLCDGEWHKIQAVKTRNVIMLGVDDNFVEPAIGKPKIGSADTKDPLHFGGVPKPKLTKGIDTTKQFVGCIRNVEINKKTQSLTAARSVGNVNLSVCPIN